jgi:transcriptional regulator with XRE-family HTH domain
MMTVKPSAGSLVRTARRAAGLTQQKLAEMAGTSRPYLASVESGDQQTTPEWLDRCASALGVPPERVGLCLVQQTNCPPDQTNDLPPLAPSGKTIALTIDYSGGADHPCRLVAASTADAQALIDLGIPTHLDARGPDLNRMLILCSNRQVDVLFRYDRKPRACPAKPPADKGAAVNGKPRGDVKGKATALVLLLALSAPGCRTERVTVDLPPGRYPAGGGAVLDVPGPQPTAEDREVTR